MAVPRHAAADRPATYSQALANREYRSLFLASSLSWFGDYIARAAVTALVFSTTRSVILSAAAFAIGFLPGLTFGPFLAAAADRYSSRSVMVVCDVARAGLIALVALPHMPTAAILVVLFLTTLLNAPFDASRSALLPRILSGDTYVVAVSLQNTTSTLAQVAGYVTGGALAPFYPRAGILLDTVTFLGSALLIRNGIAKRDRAATSGRRNLARETAAGFALVLSQPVLRSVAFLAVGTATFVVVPEGLAAAWAGHLAHNASDRGFDQALIMMSVPVGGIIGGIVVARLLTPSYRDRLIRPLAVLTPLALTPALIDLPAPGVAVLGVVSGFACGGLIPLANALYVQALPNAYRARGFGVMQFGLQLSQGGALLATGWLSGSADLTDVVGWWSIGGVCVMVVVGLLWPSRETIARSIEEVALANAEPRDVPADAGHGRHATRSSPGPVSGVPRQVGDTAAISAPDDGPASGATFSGDDPARADATSPGEDLASEGTSGGVGIGEINAADLPVRLGDVERSTVDADGADANRPATRAGAEVDGPTVDAATGGDSPDLETAADGRASLRTTPGTPRFEV